MENYKNFSLDNIIYFCEQDFIYKTEQWVDVLEYEGRYKVSDLGRVKSLLRTITRSDGRTATYKSVVLKQFFSEEKYNSVSLTIGSRLKTFSVHTLVFYSFTKKRVVKNLIVDHVNNDKRDNRLLNLQLISYSNNNSKDKVSKSGVSGATLTQNNTYMCSIVFNKKKIHLGTFMNKTESNILFNKAKEMIEKGCSESELLAIRELKTNSLNERFIKKTRYDRYQVRFTKDKKSYHLGTFETLEIAKRVRDDFFAIFAKLN